MILLKYRLRNVRRWLFLAFDPAASLKLYGMAVRVGDGTIKDVIGR